LLKFKFPALRLRIKQRLAKTNALKEIAVIAIEHLSGNLETSLIFTPLAHLNLKYHIEGFSAEQISY